MSPSDFARFQPSIKPGTVPPTKGLAGDHSTDQQESNDETEESDLGYGRNLDEIDVLQPDKLVQFLIGDELLFTV